jgi:hypothetical protein
MIKDIKIDPYKSIFLLLLSIFIYCYYLNSKNGRFTSSNDKGEITDTRTGKVYIPLNYKESADPSFISTKPIIK